MLPDHWCEHIIEPKEAYWYNFYRRQYEYRMYDKKATRSNVFRHLEHILKDTRIMANEKKKPAVKRKKSNNELRWISVSLNDEDQVECDKWLDANIPECLGYVCNLAERGFSVSLKPGRDDDFMATVFGDVGQGDNRETIGVSAFAFDPGDALAGVLYKFIVVLGWGEDIPERADTAKRRFR